MVSIVELAKAYGRYGYTRIKVLLHRKDWSVDHQISGADLTLPDEYTRARFEVDCLHLE